MINPDDTLFTVLTAAQERQQALTLLDDEELFVSYLAFSQEIRDRFPGKGPGEALRAYVIKR